MGANHFVNVKEDGALDKLAGTFNLIINTTNVAPGVVLYTVGAVTDTFGVTNAFPVILGQKSLSASPLGSVAVTRKMIGFCARHAFAPITDTFKMADINDAFEKLMNGSPRYRLVLEH